MKLLRSLLFNLFLYAGIVVVFLIALPALFLPAKITLFFGKFLGHYVVFVVRIFLNTKVEFKGLENIPKTEKYFVASAHQSMFETFALQSVLDYPVFILKKELLKIPIFGLYLKKIKSIEIVRDTTTKDNLNFFDKVANTIKNEKRPLLIFPQGTRVKIDDNVPFKKGDGESKTDSYGTEKTNDPSGKYLISGLRQIIGGQKSESQLTLIRDVFTA